MKIIISPAKKMNMDDGLPYKDLPCFLDKTEVLMKILQSMTINELQKLWQCNDELAQLNFKRFSNMRLTGNLTPAVIAYEGLQYQHMAPSVMENEALAYLEKHLRILSGFYGLLKPFDGVTPQRLEMQAKLTVENKKDLYAYWGNLLYKKLVEEDHVILNLASKEYSKCIEKFLEPDVKFITCEFLTEAKGKLVQKGTLAKMARGEMVRFLALNNITEPEEAKNFTALGFVFKPELSSESKYVFVSSKAK